LLPASDQTAGVSALLANPESGLSSESPLVILFLSSVATIFFAGLTNSSSSASSTAFSSVFLALLLGVKKSDILDFSVFSTEFLTLLLGVKKPEIFICILPLSFTLGVLGVLAAGVLTSLVLFASLGVLASFETLFFLPFLGLSGVIPSTMSSF